MGLYTIEKGPRKEFELPYFRGNTFVAANPLQSYANLIVIAGINLHFAGSQLSTVEKRTVLWITGERRTPIMNERVAGKE